MATAAAAASTAVTVTSDPKTVDSKRNVNERREAAFVRSINPRVLGFISITVPAQTPHGGIEEMNAIKTAVSEGTGLRINDTARRYKVAAGAAKDKINAAQSHGEIYAILMGESCKFEAIADPSDTVPTTMAATATTAVVPATAAAI